MQHIVQLSIMATSDVTSIPSVQVPSIVPHSPLPEAYAPNDDSAERAAAANFPGMDQTSGVRNRQPPVQSLRDDQSSTPTSVTLTPTPSEEQEATEGKKRDSSK